MNTKTKTNIIVNILVYLGYLHYHNGGVHKPKWSQWIPGGNEISNNKRIPIKKRFCKICGKTEHK